MVSLKQGFILLELLVALALITSFMWIVTPLLQSLNSFSLRLVLDKIDTAQVELWKAQSLAVTSHDVKTVSLPFPHLLQKSIPVLPSLTLSVVVYEP